MLLLIGFCTRLFTRLDYSVPTKATVHIPRHFFHAGHVSSAISVADKINQIYSLKHVKKNVNVKIRARNIVRCFVSPLATQAGEAGAAFPDNCRDNNLGPPDRKTGAPPLHQRLENRVVRFIIYTLLGREIKLGPMGGTYSANGTHQKRTETGWHT